MQTDKKEAMPKISDYWERLSAVIELAEMTPNYFARYIGLHSGENIYRIKRGQNGISRDVADRVVSKFPQISKGWLMTGEGQMYVDEELQVPSIPLYEKNLETVLAGGTVAPSCYLSLPILGRCELAVRFSDEPDTVYLLAKIDKEELKEGCKYVFLVKKTLYLHRWNFDFEIRPDEGDRVYAIKGVLSIVED